MRSSRSNVTDERVPQTQSAKKSLGIHGETIGGLR